MNDLYRKGCALIKVLFDAGYLAYFAGGWVRDHLLGKPQSEIDIATSADPKAVCSLFEKTIPLGVDYGVVIVIFEGQSFEVTTFRKDRDYLDGRHPQSIDFSNPVEDAKRRDFTINGMFFDPRTQTVLDYVGGVQDLKKGIIRAIGDPFERFTEDRLRLIRAVRFAARFNFTLESATYEAIARLASTVCDSVSIERIAQEFAKMNAYPNMDQALVLMHETHLLSTIFPALSSLTLFDVRDRTRLIPYLPLHTPFIVPLLALFEPISLEEKIKVAHFLKISNADIELLELIEKAKELLSHQACDRTALAYLFATPRIELVIDILAAQKENEAKSTFIAYCQKWQTELALHIQRLKDQRPVLTAKQLQKEGIQSGPSMGILLKEAIRLSIEDNIHTPEELLARLKQHPSWG